MTPDDAPAYALALQSTTRDAAQWLAVLPQPVIAWRPTPSAWSIKEIIGHLVDSAANNHQRFVRAEQQSDLVFPEYDQEHWVRAQAYDAAPWTELVSLWAAYNAHLARVMSTLPASARERRHERHNLHQIGWRPFAADQPATLGDLMHDYVLHLEHHLSQVRDRIRGAEATLSARA
jgi:hypothetical protein